MNEQSQDPGAAALPLESISAYRSLDDLCAERQQLAEAGRTVVFSNGCFDILHVGHVRYLKASRALGDVLVVGINSDASVRAIKGEGRPIRNAALRIEMLAELRCVDYITVFEEPSVTPTLLKLSPDIYTKGGDYTLDTIEPGLRDAVLEHGIRIEFPAHVPGASTSEILGKSAAQSET